MTSRWWILILLSAAGAATLFGLDLTTAAEDAAIDYPADPNELLRVKWDAVIAVLQKKDVNEHAKADRISEILSPAFDFPVMAKLALGKKNWLKLTTQQRERFTDLFVERLRTSYQERVSFYTDEKILFRPAVKKKEGIVYIPMKLISGEETIEIVYKLRRTDDIQPGESDKRWKIYDVEIEGVSILLTYRSQFDDILRRGTVEQLLSELEKGTPSPRAKPTKNDGWESKSPA